MLCGTIRAEDPDPWIFTLTEPYNSFFFADPDHTLNVIHSHYFRN